MKCSPNNKPCSYLVLMYKHWMSLNFNSFPKRRSFCSTRPLLWERWVVARSASHAAALASQSCSQRQFMTVCPASLGAAVGEVKGSLVSSSVTFFTAPWKPRNILAGRLHVYEFYQESKRRWENAIGAVIKEVHRGWIQVHAISTRTQEY